MDVEQPHQEQAQNNDNQDDKRYNAALSLLFYEGQIAWQMNLLFIGLNVGIGTIIGSSLTKFSTDYILLFYFFHYWYFNKYCLAWNI